MKLLKLQVCNSLVAEGLRTGMISFSNATSEGKEQIRAIAGVRLIAQCQRYKMIPSETTFGNLKFLGSRLNSWKPS